MTHIAAANRAALLFESAFNTHGKKKMAEPSVSRCYLCDTKLCILPIIFKCIYGCFLSNHYSQSWESSLPPERRAEQRKKKDNIRFFQILAVLPIIVQLIVISEYHGLNSYTALSTVASIVYLSAFWYVIQGRDEFGVTSRAWHSGQKRQLLSKICMPEHVKCIVTVGLLTQAVAHYLIKGGIAWYLVAMLHLTFSYYFLDSNFAEQFPRDMDGNDELVYVIETE